MALYDIGGWVSAAKQHREFERKWAASCDTWFERTLGRLIGTYSYSVGIRDFHRAAADKYDKLVARARNEGGVTNELDRLEDRLSNRTAWCMLHAAYGAAAFDDIRI
jgi:hypothetical protein